MANVDAQHSSLSVPDNSESAKDALITNDAVSQQIEKENEDELANPDPKARETSSLPQRSPLEIQRDPTIQGNYHERMLEIIEEHKRSGHISIKSWPYPFGKPYSRIRGVIAPLIIVGLAVVWVGVINGVVDYGSDISADRGIDFTNVFSTIVLILASASVVLGFFDPIQETETIAATSLALVYSGSIALYVAVVMFPSFSLTSTWLAFAATCMVACGAVAFGVVTLVNGLLPTMIGAFVLGIGMIIISVGTLLSERNTNNASAMRIAGCVLAFIGCVIMSYRAALDLERPFLKPKNYFLCGVSLFGIGAFTAIWPFASDLANTYYGNSSYNVSPNALLFAVVLFVLGAAIMLLSGYRELYAMSSILEDRYPLTSELISHVEAARVFFYASIIFTVGSAVSILGSFFGATLSQVVFAMTGGFVVVVMAFLLLTVSLFLSYGAPRGAKLAMSLLTCGFFVFLFGLINALQDLENPSYSFSSSSTPPQLLIAASTLILVSCGILVLSLFNLRVPSTFSRDKSIRVRQLPRRLFWLLLHPGNYVFLIFGLMLPLFCIFAIVAGSSLMKGLDDVEDFLRWTRLSLIFLIQASAIAVLHSHMAVETLESTSLRDDSSTFDEQHRQRGVNAMRGHIDVTSSEHGTNAEERSREHCDVLIIGAGPSGLTLANELGLRGIKTILVEQRKECISDARFIFLNSATCEGLHSLGILDKMLEFTREQGIDQDQPFGATWLHCLDERGFSASGQRAASTVPGRSTLMANHCPSSATSRFLGSPHATQVPVRLMQSHQEHVLRERADALETVSIRYGWLLQTFEKRSTDGKIIAYVENTTDGSITEIEAKYMVSCEGPNGPVVQKLGVLFDGYINLFPTKSILFHAPGLMMKFAAKFGFAHQYLVSDDNNIMVMVCVDPIRGLWNIPMRYPRGSPNDDVVAFLKRMIGDPDQEIELLANGDWFVNFFIARQYRFGNILLCGDAARSWPPAGGIGGNTAFGDAHNLGWKLAACVKGWSGDALLESYAIERRQVAIRTALYVKNVLPTPDRLLNAFQLMRKFPFLRGVLEAKFRYGNEGVRPANHLSSDGIQLGVRFDLSPVVVREKLLMPDDPHPAYRPRVSNGARAPRFYLNDGKSKCFFDELMRDGLTLVVFVQENPSKSYVDSIKTIFMEVGAPLKVLEVDLDLTLGQVDPISAECYIGKSMVIIRPDLIISWHQDTSHPLLDTPELRQMVEIVTGQNIHNNARECAALDNWLLREFHRAIRALENTWPKAVRVSGQTKFEAVNEVRSRGQGEGITLTTKTVQVKSTWGQSKQASKA